MKRIAFDLENALFQVPEAMEEQGFKRLAPEVIEKDFLITEIVRGISNIVSDHRLVFCGGTCLSKAYQALDRMSEDVDFKVLRGDNSSQSLNQLRRSLSRLKGDVLQVLESLGYLSSDLDVKARDNNQYIRIDAYYETLFGGNHSLRDHVQLELNFTTIQMPFIRKQICPMADQWLIKDTLAQATSIPCVSLEEALAEKLIAFPRRLAHFLRRKEAGINRRFDETLVRHIYDVAQLTRKFPELLEPAKIETIGRLLENLILKDARDFKNQHPQFLANPQNELRWAMSRPVLSYVERNYNNFLIDMVYAPLRDNPPFEEAAETFRTLLDRVLNAQSLREQDDAEDRQNVLRPRFS